MRALPPAALLCLALAGCAVGPDYQRPAIEVPAAWVTERPWLVAKPADGADRGPWWQMFGDAHLNRLEEQAVAGNSALASTAEHFAQARALARVSEAALVPQLAVNAGTGRLKISKDRPLASYAVPNSSTVQTDLTGNFAVHYELDVFGAVRRQVESARAGAQQAGAQLVNARLVLSAELAADYFNLRALDAEIDVVRQNIAAQRRALEFVSARHDMGAASGLDLAQQQSQLDTTITQIDLLRVQRDLFEHAIATLVGVAAPGFAIAPEVLHPAVPDIPVGVPSDLVQRRPDVAAAERAMAAANAQIGVARAAWFPSFSLGAAYGVESNKLSTLFSAGSNLWSLGVSASQALFDAGRRNATIDFAQAGYRATVDDYRSAVLTALEEVENGMTGIADLARAAGEANAAVASAQRVVDVANDRYMGGLATYLDVVTAQQALLANQRQQVQINGQQMLTAIYLVKALGGGWRGSGAEAVAPADGALARN